MAICTWASLLNLFCAALLMYGVSMKAPKCIIPWLAVSVTCFVISFTLQIVGHYNVIPNVYITWKILGKHNTRFYNLYNVSHNNELRFIKIIFCCSADSILRFLISGNLVLYFQILQNTEFGIVSTFSDSLPNKTRLPSHYFRISTSNTQSLNIFLQIWIILWLPI